MSETKYDIAVILINYNSAAYTEACLQSIVENTRNIRFQIIVVDNNSEPGDFERLRSFCDGFQTEHLMLIRSRINTGFGGGNMAGVQHANAHYYAFVNNDCVLLNDCLSILKTEMDLHPGYGVCGPMAFRTDGSVLPVLDHFTSPAKEILGRRFLETINPAKYPNRKKKYTQPQQAQFISGSFMLIRAADFDLAGGFDSHIFLYYEETDLCMRLAGRSKLVFLIPDGHYIHHHGASTGKSIAIKTELKISLLYVVRKHYGYISYLVLLNHLRITYFFSSLFKPKYWPLFRILMLGAPVSASLRTKQTVRES